MPIEKRALVVDDDDVCRRVIVRALQRSFWTVEAVASGQAALRAFPMGDFSLVVCDVNLGDLDGIEVARRMSQERPELHVLIVSGLEDNLRRARAAGFTCTLAKPFDVGTLSWLALAL